MSLLYGQNCNNESLFRPFRNLKPQLFFSPLRRLAKENLTFPAFDNRDPIYRLLRKKLNIYLIFLVQVFFSCTAFSFREVGTKRCGQC